MNDSLGWGGEREGRGVGEGGGTGREDRVFSEEEQLCVLIAGSYTCEKVAQNYRYTLRVVNFLV